MPGSALVAAKKLMSLLEGMIFREDGLAATLQGIVETGRELLEADLAVAFSLNPVTGEFTSAVATDGGVASRNLPALSPPRPDGITRKVMESRLLFIEDLAGRDGEPYRSTFSETAGIGSFAAVALPTSPDREALAVLYLDFFNARKFSVAEKGDLQFFADQAALALQNIRLLEALRRVNETGQGLTRELDSERVLSSVVDWIRRAAQADLAVLYPYHPGKNRLFSPEVGGELLHPEFPQPEVLQPDDVAYLTFAQPQPLFLHDSSALYGSLGGNPETRKGTFEKREQICSTAALPLKVGKERVGVLFVNYRRPQRFDEPQTHTIQSLASFAAIAIRNSHFFKALRERQLQQLKALSSIERSITSKPELEGVLQTILDQSLRLVRADEASIKIYNERSGRLETKAAIGPNRERNLQQSFMLGEEKGITRWAFENKQTVRVDNVRTDPKWKDLYVAVSEAVVSELDVPLLDGDSVLGVMNFESSEPSAFAKEDEGFFEALAEHTLLAIRNAQAYKRETRIARENAALVEVSKQITTEVDVTRILNVILDRALELTGASAGEVMLHDPVRKDLYSIAVRGGNQDLLGRRQRLDQGIIGWVATQKQPFFQDVRQPPWSEIYLGIIPDTKAESAVPLLGRDRSLRGVLDVESTDPERFDERDLWLLTALAEWAVIALQNVERFERAEKVARRFEDLHQAGFELGKITSINDIGKTYDTIIDFARRHTDGEVVIRRFNAETRELVAVKIAERQRIQPFPAISIDEPSLNAQVFRERRTIVVHDVHNPPPGVEIKLSDDATQSLMIMPIWLGTDSSYYGNLALSHEELYHFIDADEKLFESLAQLLALTIDRLETVKQRQEAEQQVIALGFVSSIGQSALELAHRLGNYLGTVEASIADVREELGGPDQTSSEVAERLDEVVGNVSRVLTLVTRLKREVAELRSAESARRRERVAIWKLLEDARRALPPLPVGIELLLLEINEPETEVLVVPDQVADILQNLVINAFEAMQGGGTITIRARSVARFVEVDVSDTGEGIAASERSKIFQLFYSTKDSTGFGLWSAQAYARANGGDLQLAPESEHGQGATFTLSLPRAEARL